MSYQYNPPPTYAQPPTYAPPAANRGRAERVEPAALIAFFLAVASLFIPVFPALTALALAPAAGRNIKASKGLRSGRGLTVAAVVLSVLTLLTNVAVAVWAMT